MFALLDLGDCVWPTVFDVLYPINENRKTFRMEGVDGDDPHGLLWVEFLHKIHNVPGKDVAAGVGLDEITVGSRQMRVKLRPVRLAQVAGPIGIDAAGMGRQDPSKVQRHHAGAEDHHELLSGQPAVHPL